MKLRAAFMGSPAFAVPSLRAVAEVCDLRVVVCQPDRPAGRGRTLQAPPVKLAAQALGVEVRQPEKMRDGTLAANLRTHSLDIIVLAAFGRILPPAILEVPRYGCLNVHASLLPRWRGAAPIQRAILAGDRETGICIMRMDEGLDTGPVYLVHRTAIGPRETSGELFERLAQLGADVLREFLPHFPEVPEPRAQDNGAATYAAALRKAEGEVDWRRPAQQVADHVRGMDPWPGAVAMRAGEPLKLFGVAPAAQAELRWSAADKNATPGTVLGCDADALWIACLRGVIGVEEVQPAGRKRMPAAAYAAGRPFAAGECLVAS